MEIQASQRTSSGQLFFRRDGLYPRFLCLRRPIHWIVACVLALVVACAALAVWDTRQASAQKSKLEHRWPRDAPNAHNMFAGHAMFLPARPVGLNMANPARVTQLQFNQPKLLIAAFVGKKQANENANEQEGALHVERLCMPEIVRETCGLLERGPGIASQARGANLANRIQSLLSATEESMATLWEGLGFGAHHATCLNLCLAVTDQLSKVTQLPPANDVGCYAAQSGTEISCDLDFSPDAISSFVKPDRDSLRLPRAEAGTFEEDVMDYVTSDQTPVRRLASPPAAFPSEMQDSHHVAYSKAGLLRQIARLFRIYPAPARKPKVPSPIEPRRTPPIDEPDRKIDKVLAKAQAYMARARLYFMDNSTKRAFTKYFGQDTGDEKAKRAEVLRSMNSVIDMIDNVAFYNVSDKGPCSGRNLIAYVYPRAGTDVKQRCDGPIPARGEKCTRNSQGQFLYYLCPPYWRRDESQQILTLIHEGSHHGSAFTDDVCIDEFYFGAESFDFKTVPESHVPMGDRQLGKFLWTPIADGNAATKYLTVGGRAMAQVWLLQPGTVILKYMNRRMIDNCTAGIDKAYGRTRCLDIARLSPLKAVRNADSIAFYIVDAVSSSTGKRPPTASRTQVGKFKVGDVVQYTGNKTVARGRRGVIQYSRVGVRTNHNFTQGVVAFHQGRKGIVDRVLQPLGHKFVVLTWRDGTKSNVIPVEELRPDTKRFAHVRFEGMDLPIKVRMSHLEVV